MSDPQVASLSLDGIPVTMSETLLHFVESVFRSNDLQVPYFDGASAALTFLKGTLEVDVLQTEDATSVALNRRFNRFLLNHKGPNGTELSTVLVTFLKPLLTKTAAFERSYDRDLLASCLLYALRLKPRIPVSDIEQLLAIVTDASSFIQPKDAADAFWEAARMVMFATLQTLLPQESNEREAEDADESFLESLSASTALAHYFQSTPHISDPMRLVLQFAYVLLQVRCSSRASWDTLQDRLDVCYKVGVFAALYEILTDRIFMQRFRSDDRLLCFEIAYRLLTMFLDVEYRNLTSSRHILNANTERMVDQKSDYGLNGDDFCSLMRCMSLVFRHCPDLIIDASETVSFFFTWMLESKFMRRSPTVMKMYVDMVSALATGEGGADRIFNQLVESARNKFSVSHHDFRYISIDYIFDSLLSLCNRLIATAGMPILGIYPEEVPAFAAYMKLLGKLFHSASPETVGQMIFVLESEFGSHLRNEALRDIILLIFCKPCPPELKAAACAALSGIGRAPGTAEIILKNLKLVGLYSTAEDSRRVNRFYLQSQLASIEAPMNEYSCTISTIRMINTLLMHASALPDQESAMIEVTVFCKDVILDVIWKYLRFEDNGQLWELLSAVFEHFLICIERIEVDRFSSTSNQPSPGQLVLDDILGKGTVYKAMRACAIKNYNEHSSQFFPSNSANDAIMNLLDLLLAVFEVESRQPPSSYPFKDTLLGDKEFVQKTLFSVDASLPDGIQISAVELLRRLFGSAPELMASLDIDVRAALLRGIRSIYANSLYF